MATYYLTKLETPIPSLPHNPIIVFTVYPNDMLLDRSSKKAWGRVTFRDELTPEELKKYKLHKGALLGHTVIPA